MSDSCILNKPFYFVRNETDNETGMMDFGFWFSLKGAQ